MRKVKLYVLGLSLVLGLTACSKAQDESTNAEDMTMIVEETQMALGGSVETQVYEEIITEQTEEQILVYQVEKVYYEPMKEIMDANALSGVIQIEDKIVRLPITLSEMMELGFYYENSNGNNNTLIQPGESFYISLYYNGEKLDYLVGENDKEETLTIEQINPKKEYFEFREEPKNSTIYFPKGIVYGDSEEVIEERLGFGCVNNSHTYVYGNNDSITLGMNIVGNEETNKIEYVKIAKSFEPHILDEFTMINIDNVKDKLTDESYQLSFGCFPNYYNDDRRVLTFFNDNDMIYKITIEYEIMDINESKEFAKMEEDIFFDETDEKGIRRVVAYPSYSSNTRKIAVLKGEKIFFAEVILNKLIEDHDPKIEIIDKFSTLVVKTVVF